MYTSITHRGESVKDKMIENYYILNQIVQSIDTGILIIHNGRLLHVNNETRRISQRTYRDIEQGLMECVAPAYRILAMRTYFMVLRGEHDRLECFIDILLPSGAPKTVRCRFSRIRIMETDAIFVSVHDLLQTYNRSDSTPNGVLCRRFKSDYSRIFAEPYDFAILLDEYHIITNIGLKFRSITGFSRSQYIGRRFDTLPGLDPCSEVVKMLRDISGSTTHSAASSTRISIRISGGRTAWFVISFMPIRFRAVRLRTCVLFRLDSISDSIPYSAANGNISDIPQYDFSGKTVIVAEDAEINFILLKKILEKTGIRILHARNGCECVELYEQNPSVSLILMDMQMPVMDGYQAASEILKRDKSVPIIAQTAFDLLPERQRIMNVGCVDFVSKPIDRKVLLQSIAKVIR